MLGAAGGNDVTEVQAFQIDDSSSESEPEPVFTKSSNDVKPPVVQTFTFEIYTIEIRAISCTFQGFC